MSAFVGGLHMDIHIVAIALQRFYRGFRFALEVGLVSSSRTLYVDDFHFCAYADTFEQVDCGYHRAFDTVFFFKRSKFRTGAFAPKPNAVGRSKPLGNTSLVDRVVFKKFV